MQSAPNGGIWDWVWLIDDTLSGWEPEEFFLEFFEFLNTLHDCIKLTNERAKDYKIAIFDILIIRTDTGYSTTVYRKATHQLKLGKKNHQLLEH